MGSNDYERGIVDKLVQRVSNREDSTIVFPGNSAHLIVLRYMTRKGQDSYNMKELVKGCVGINGDREDRLPDIIRSLEEKGAVERDGDYVSLTSDFQELYEK